MDILNTVKSVFGGDEKKNDLMSSIMSLVRQSGGLNGLISKFKSQGLGDVISSWVGTQNNLPISSDQIKKVFGDDTIKSMSTKLGMDTNVLTGQLSDLLPQVVDKLTPQGKVPEGDILSKGKDLLGGLWGKK
ncbi:MAG: DUF937 domain-containing protein [Ignavibacteriales bacterium]|nr:MAG: DUF937 domain-containing protein [Ignavibacteriales bacterium]